MRSAQRQVELRQFGNQLPVLGKANSLCKIVKLRVFSPGSVEHGMHHFFSGYMLG